MIICGYPCIGKSTLAETEETIKGCRIIDLESSNFIKDEHWVQSYVSVANDLSSQGYAVFISTHESVIRYLNGNDIDYIAVFPSESLERVWIERAIDRYIDIRTQKNKQAMLRIVEHYKEDIKFLSDRARRVATISEGEENDLGMFLNGLTIYPKKWLKPSNELLLGGHVEWSDNKPTMAFDVDNYSRQEIDLLNEAMYNYLASINYKQRFIKEN